ncbi:hypothetical protein [Streptomyces sp. NPDC056190]|uniref:hypothetical protein n=1 Tax=Streptomyces sp. NPDC056190 TaxID=3345741 RepID=UPI0035E35C67
MGLGSSHALDRVTLRWEAAAGRAYRIQGSADGEQWIDLTTGPAPTGAREPLVIEGRPPPSCANWRVAPAPAAADGWGQAAQVDGYLSPFHTQRAHDPCDAARRAALPTEHGVHYRPVAIDGCTAYAYLALTRAADMCRS